MNSMTQKDIYNLHYDDVQGNVLHATWHHGTTVTSFESKENSRFGFIKSVHDLKLMSTRKSCKIQLILILQVLIIHHVSLMQNPHIVLTS